MDFDEQASQKFWQRQSSVVLTIICLSLLIGLGITVTQKPNQTTKTYSASTLSGDEVTIYKNEIDKQEIENYSYQELIDLTHGSTSEELIYEIFIHKFNVGLDHERQQLREAIREYPDFPYVKKLWSDSAVLNYDLAARSPWDVYFRFTYASRTPEFRDFAHGIRFAPWTSTPWEYKGDNFHFSEFYPATYDNDTFESYPAESIGWIKIHGYSTPNRVEFEIPKSIQNELVSELSVNAFSDITAEQKFVNYDKDGLLHYELRFVNPSQDAISVRFVSINSLEPWKMVPWDERVETMPALVRVTFNDLRDVWRLDDINKLKLDFSQIEFAEINASTSITIDMIKAEDNRFDTQQSERFCSFGYSPESANLSDDYQFYVMPQLRRAPCDYALVPLLGEEVSTSSAMDPEYRLRVLISGGSNQDNTSKLLGVEFSNPFVIVPIDNSIGEGEIMKFTDRIAGASFLYPTDWGPVIMRQGDDSSGLVSYAFSGLNPNAIFYAATKATQLPQARERGWIDSSMSISETYLSECDSDQTCTPYQNVNGLVMAKFTNNVFNQNPYTFDPDLDKTPVKNLFKYFNPITKYHGVVLSDTMLEADQKQLFEEIIVNSLKFDSDIGE